MTEELHQVGKIKVSTYVNALPRENVEHRHCCAHFWLTTYFTALAHIYIDTRQIDCVRWLALEAMRMLGGEQDTLCVLWKVARRLSFAPMPCIWHYDGRWHRRRCSECMGGMSPADGAAWTQVAMGGEPPRNKGGVVGGWQSAWSLVDETCSKWGGEFK